MRIVELLTATRAGGSPDHGIFEQRLATSRVRIHVHIPNQERRYMGHLGRSIFLGSTAPFTCVRSRENHGGHVRGRPGRFVCAWRSRERRAGNGYTRRYCTRNRAAHRKQCNRQPHRPTNRHECEQQQHHHRGRAEVACESECPGLLLYYGKGVKELFENTIRISRRMVI
jgi:hypothetical protein